MKLLFLPEALGRFEQIWDLEEGQILLSKTNSIGHMSIGVNFSLKKRQAPSPE